MPVNYATPSADQLKPVAGVRLGVAEAGIRKANRRDLTLIELAEGSTVAGVFTLNRFCAAPVQVCRHHLDRAQGASANIRALVINTGIANAGTGESGMQTAKQSCDAVAKQLGIAHAQVLPFSTGVILEPLPVDRLIAGLPAAAADLKADNWHAAAHAIMTTDTVAKAASRQITVQGKTITLTGISKGAGMIKPNMATMLGFLATDAGIAQPLLDQLVKDAADVSFNCISIDGDTSTNDSFILMATAKAGLSFTSGQEAGWAEVRQAVIDIATDLAQAIVRDGEGATKFMSILVEGGNDAAECKQVAYAVGHSPLVKTAFFASDPNLGRILAAIGYAGVTDLNVDGVKVWLGSHADTVLVAEKGGRAASYQETDGARIMANAEITVKIDLGRGQATGRVYTCDLSYDYVKINADYRS